jgi:predicted nucleotide-binding protein
MKADLRLIIPLNDFIEELRQQSLSFSANDVLAQLDFDEAENKYEAWKGKVLGVYERSFNAVDNVFYNRIANDGLDDFFPRRISDTEIRSQVHRIKAQIKWDIHCIPAYELLYATHTEAEELRSKSYTVDQKLNLILEKLYELRGDRSVPVKWLLTFNGVKQNRDSEAQELTEQLEKRGLVTTPYYGDADSDIKPAAKITSKGEQLVENKILKAKVQKKNSVTPRSRNINAKNIFIVHGHDNLARLELRQLIKEEFGLNPIILGEKPIKSLSTIFQKIDEHARDCVAAIILMTPDDMVGDEARARENVLLELGYFIGLFPPDDRKVLILRKANAHIPSDIQGVERIDFKDSITEVHYKLQKQLKHWGIID